MTMISLWSGASGQCVDYGNSLRWVGQIDWVNDSWVSGLEMEIRENVGFMASNAAGLAIINLETPVQPRVLLTMDTPGFAKALALHGDLVLVADAYSGLQIIDCSELDQPQIIASLGLSGLAIDVAIHGDHAYVCTTGGQLPGIHIVDISMPMSPVEVGYLAVQDASRWVGIVDQHLVIGSESMITVASLTVPSEPQVLGELALGTSLIKMDCAGSHVLCSLGHSGFRIVRISPTEGPVIESSHSPDLEVQSVVIDGDTAFVSNATVLAAIDISGAGQDAVIAMAPSGWSLPTMALLGENLFATGSIALLQVYDVSNLGLHSVIAQEPLPTYFTQGVEIRDGYAYIGGRDGLCIVNVENPASPTVVGYLDIDAPIYAVSLQGDYLYGASDHLCVIDVSDPQAPVLLACHDTSSYLKDIFATGHRLYVIDQNLGVCVYDITDPGRPRWLDTIRTYGFATAMARDGNLLHVVSTAGELNTLELTGDTATLLSTFVGQIAWDGRSTDLAVDGTLIYVADQRFGLQVIDVSDPSNPIALGRIDPPGYSDCVAARDGMAYLAADHGLFAIDLSDPSSPTAIGAIYLDSDISSLQLTDDALIATTRSHLLTIPVHCAERWAQPLAEAAAGPSRLDAIYPNPFNPITTIMLSCQPNEFLDLRVFDLKGRHIATIAQETAVAGQQMFRWEGRDDAGHPVPAGVYVLRLTTSSGVENRKILLAK